MATQLSQQAVDQWLDSGFALDEGRTWAAYGFKPVRACEWADAGFTTATVLSWLGRLSPVDAGEWAALRYPPLEASRWLRWGADPELVRASVDWPAERAPDLRFKRAGFTLDEALDWARSEFEETYWGQDSVPWGIQGFSPREAADICRKLVSADPRTARKVIDAGLRASPENLKKWVGLDSDEILNAIDRGFPDAAAYRPFAHSSLDYETIEAIRSEVADLAWRGDLLPGTVEKLHALHQQGVFAAEALPWIAVRFPTEEIVRWIPTGLRPAVALSWRTEGFAPQSASAWIAAGFELGVARRWLVDGVGPAAAKRRTDAGLKPSRS